MSAMALGIVHDLRQRRLLPIAVLLLVIAVALPLFVLKPAEEPVPAPAPATATGAAAATTVDGLPSPQQALSDKPLVSLAVLDQPSDLGEFESKDPFKPIEQVSTDGATPGTGSTPTLEPAPGGAPAGGSMPSGPASSGGSPGGSGGGSGGGGGGGTPDAAPQAPQPAPKQNGGDAPKTEKRLTYTLDLTIRGPKGVRRYRSLPKLALLPSQASPLLVFLGIEDNGTKALFLVDAKLKSQDGEGTCSPSPAQCATLALAPGEEHTLINDQGQMWTIRIVEVRETTVARAAAAARKAQKRARQSNRNVSDRPVPRFVPPMITDLFTGGRS